MIKIIKGEGMPIYNKDHVKAFGDLYISFNIVFP